MQYQSKFEDEVNEIGGHNSAKDLLLRGGVPKLILMTFCPGNNHD
jgi:hypothetical protein